MTARVIPALGPTRELTLPGTVEHQLDNGLNVIVVPRRSVPLVEVRLRVPFSRAELDLTYLATSSLLGQTMLSGTADLSKVDIAARLQSVGGALSASVDPDRLLVAGNGLADGLADILGTLTEVLNGASYPAGEVETERSRLADRIQVARSQPAHLARVALLRRIFGNHPYAVQTPEVKDVLEVGSAELAALHAAGVHPAGATLVLVGDLDPDVAVATAERTLGSWQGTGGAEQLPPIPPLSAGPLVLADRPGSVQSSVRLALPAVGRTHPDYAALLLANLVFGGYFSSRWVENIREKKGYSYGPHSLVEHAAAGSSLIVAAEVATEVTAPALLETWYELGRIATQPVGDEELEQARQYALGSLVLGVSTQAGLAGLVSTYAGFGLRLGHLAEHSARLAAVTRDEVAAAATQYLAPARAVTVVLGDAGKVESSLSGLSAVESRSD